MARHVGVAPNPSWHYSENATMAVGVFRANRARNRLCNRAVVLDRGSRLEVLLDSFLLDWSRR
eukprot:scaffold4790_cov98-Cylindrotheca_fusiformis.AAC.9